MILRAQSHRSDAKAYASGVAAALAGASAGAIARGRRNVLPGALVFGVLGLTGQHMYDKRRSPQASSNNADGVALSNVIRGSWYPLKPLTDEEYEEMLQEKILRAESQIAILEEDIRDLKDESSR